MELTKSAKGLLWFGLILAIVMPLATIATFIFSLVVKLPFFITFLLGISIIMSFLFGITIRVASSIIIQDEGYKPEDFTLRDLL